MKVENNNINPLKPERPDETRSSEKIGRRSETASTSVRSRDKAELSEQARLLSKARTAINDTSDVRTELVASLQQQINQGSYQVPVEALARKLVERLKDQ